MTTDTIIVRYFARLREDLGTDSEELRWEPERQTAGDLLDDLAARGGAWRQLAGDQPVMIAINQAMAKPQTPIRPGDEVAFFPPVTGG